MSKAPETIEGEIQGHEANGEAGTIYEVQCPRCKGTVDVAHSAWWKPVCQCGIYWRVVAIGELPEAGEGER